MIIKAKSGRSPRFRSGTTQTLVYVVVDQHNALDPQEANNLLSTDKEGAPKNIRRLRFAPSEIRLWIRGD